eukprot:488875-Amorphochlora_amoeboformis.AAC.1
MPTFPKSSKYNPSIPKVQIHPNTTQTGCLFALAYAGVKGRLIVDRDGKRPGVDRNNTTATKMPPGIPPPPPGA